MKTESKPTAIIIREGKIAEDTQESVENDRVFWLLETEYSGIQFHLVDRTPELAKAAAEKLASDIPKYSEIRAWVAYRSQTDGGILTVYSRNKNDPPQRLNCGGIVEGVLPADPCPLETVEELMKKLITWEDDPQNLRHRRPNPFDHFGPEITPG